MVVDATEFLLCFQQAGGGPTQRLIPVAPTLYVSRHRSSSTGMIRLDWWWPFSDVAPLLYPSDATCFQPRARRKQLT
jgi:hypothetical protein